VQILAELICLELSCDVQTWKGRFGMTGKYVKAVLSEHV